MRGGRVFDLKIEKGLVTARVQGSRRTPYKVLVSIRPLDEKRVQILRERGNHRIENIESLIEGTFPEELRELFIDKKGGLFPSPQEIGFNCSCPDWAYLCKHVGAVLYGIGAMFDKDPLLFSRCGLLTCRFSSAERLKINLVSSLNAPKYRPIELLTIKTCIGYSTCNKLC